MGHQKVNKAAPEDTRNRELIGLNHAVRPASSSQQKRLPATFNPKVAGSIPARPISDDHGEHGNAASTRSVLIMASPGVW